jgi:hypothetical protein
MHFRCILPINFLVRLDRNAIHYEKESEGLASAECDSTCGKLKTLWTVNSGKFRYYLLHYRFLSLGLIF